jgi:hypothetical protein
MKVTEGYSKILPGMMVAVLSVLATGCGGGDSGRSTILGSGEVADLMPPTVTMVAPGPQSVGVPTNSRVITATFSKAMEPTSLNPSSFTLACPATTPSVNGVVSYLASSQTATLTLAPASLPSNGQCTATITRSAKDMTGIPLASDFVWQFSTGSAPDTTAPAVTGTINANGATNVAVNTKIGAIFTEVMDPLSINVNTFTLKQGNSSIPGNISYSGVSAVFSPTGNLAANTSYTATMTTGVTDLAGNSMVKDYVWSWTTAAAPDTTAPTVTGSTQANGVNNVPINTQVGVTFSEAMNPLSVTQQSFSLKNAITGAVIAGVIHYSGVNAEFVPLSNLLPATPYTVTVKGGAGGVQDLAGNAMTTDFVINWTTASQATAIDATAPVVTGTLNANGATNVAVNTKVAATFSEAMNPLTITTESFTLKKDGIPVQGSTSYTGVSAVFTPTGNLDFNTRYTATVLNQATDLAGNPMASNYEWSWTTGTAPDTIAPTVTASLHANGAIDVARNTQIGVSFSEAMNPLSVTNQTFLLTNATTGAPVSGVLSYAGVNAVFVPLSILDASTRYTVTVKGGAGGVSDQAGNAMLNDFSISWTTAADAAALDTIAPTIVLVSPADLATAVSTSSLITATFDEAMNPLTLTNASFKVDGVTGNVTINALSKTVTFTPAAALANSTTYTATVSTGATDLAGNALASNKVWTFTTQAAPIVLPEINLVTAAPYGTFGGTAGMTNMGTLTQVNGDIGTTATGTSMITGFHDTLGDIYTETPANLGAVNGKIYSCTNSVTGPTSAGTNAVSCAKATQARLDAQAAYLALAAMPAGANPGGNLANLTLLPGTYTAPAGSFMIQGGNLTLDAQGNANAVWVFQMATTLTVGGPGAAFPQSIVLAGGAQAKNVFWQVGSFATINAAGGGTMVGTLISQNGASFSTAGNTTLVTLNGRVLSLGHRSRW